MKLQPVRGTRDILGDEARLFREIIDQFSNLATTYDFSEIETPIFEPTGTFKRTLGEASDIVNKEMYTFEDRGGDSITLRPEGTAPVARAIISNSLFREAPLKYFYQGPMFRYERPQKGRYRQFFQFGVEMLGVDSPTADIEVLALGQELLTRLGLARDTELEINTIGDDDSRALYRSTLVSYLSQHKDKLSEDSQKRLQTNPLRILDSKDAGDIDIVEGAPPFDEFLNDESKKFFAAVLQGLEKLNIPYKLNPRLVRGLDYYSHTVFEFTTNKLGSQNAVLSGGRYNGLIHSMGGPETPGVGWAAGLDRVALLVGEPKNKKESVGVIAVDAPSQPEALTLLQELRSQNIASQTFYSGNLSKQMKKAHKRGCKSVVLIGEKEINNKTVVIKDLETGEQREVSRSQLIENLKGQ